MPEPHLCAQCEQPFVEPVSLLGRSAGAASFVVELHCANCGCDAIALHDAADLEALDRRADRASAELAAEADVWRMVEELERVDRFAAALRAGHILPEDF